MEIMGIAITLLGVILAYIWRSNGQMQKSMAKMFEQMMEGQKLMIEGQKLMIEALSEIKEGQKGIAQMLLNQTKILERIEARAS